MKNIIEGGMFGKIYLKWFAKVGGILFILRLIILWMVREHTTTTQIIKIFGNTIFEFIILFIIVYWAFKFKLILEKKQKEQKVNKK